MSEVDHVKKYGYPNYFDDQRFGSFDPRQGFIAEKILKKHYNGALKIYFTHIRPENITRGNVSLFFSAYQSYLWNELLRRIIQIPGKDTLKAYQGIAGDYLFSIYLNDEHNEYVKKLTIPTPAANIRMPDILTETLYSKVLQDNGLRPPMFNIRKI